MGIYDDVIKAYGEQAQVDKAIEEMSELIKALLKLRYAEKDYELEICGDAVAEEMADAEIMLEQLEIIFGNAERVVSWKQKKLERLERRLKERRDGE